MTESKFDPELKAIQSIIEVLEPLDLEARKRVAEYVSRRLDLVLGATNASSIPEKPSSYSANNYPNQNVQVVDIRSLCENKKPSSASEMAALVAFYLAEFAPSEERKGAIDKKDIEKYFKQAAYPLPKVISQTLQNASRAGYFETTGGGRYKLNPVGYNLVVHGLPSKEKSIKKL